MVKYLTLCSLLLAITTQAAVSVPARIQSEDFSSYYDKTQANTGNCGAKQAVDLKQKQQNWRGKCDVTGTQATEWLTYDIEVKETGRYDINLSLSAPPYALDNNGNVVHKEYVVMLDYKELTKMRAPGFGINNYNVRFVPNQQITRGTHKLTVRFLNDGIDFNYIEVVRSQEIDNSAANLKNNPHVQVVYLRPSTYSGPDRSAKMLDAAQQIQRQWAAWNWTFLLSSNVVYINSTQPCSFFSGERTYSRIDPEVKKVLTARGAFRSDVKYLTFSECVTNPGVAAWGGGNFASFMDGVLNGINAGSRSSIGSIGHELGHTLGLAHESCFVQNGSTGPMCNGKDQWPSNQPTSEQQATVWNKGCHWIAECKKEQGLAANFSGDSMSNWVAMLMQKPAQSAALTLDEM